MPFFSISGSEFIELFVGVGAAHARFVGADLANIANEAAIIAVHKNHSAVTMPDFEDAIDRVIAGPEKGPLTYGKTTTARLSRHHRADSIGRYNISKIWRY